MYSILGLAVALMGASLPNSGASTDKTAYQFVETDFPYLDILKHQVLSSDKVIKGEVVHLNNGGYPGAPGGFNVVARTNQYLGNGQYLGLVKDVNGEDVYEFGEELGKSDKVLVSNEPDFVSILKSDVSSHRAYMFVHFESPVPSSIYFLELTADADGKLQVKKGENVDFSEYGGLWAPCAGSVTPWNTHLGVEEFPPDAKPINTLSSKEELLEQDEDAYEGMISMMRYYGYYEPDFTWEDVQEVYNPYNYGYITELGVNEEDGVEYFAKKWYHMGRCSHEATYVMPDNKTVYLADDGNNTPFYVFISDEEGDLTCGTLYAAKADQTSDEGIFDLEWIEMAYGCDDEVKEMVLDGIKFQDIFEWVDVDVETDEIVCPDGFVGPYFTSQSNMHECLKVKEGMEKAAAFLESQRYAAVIGATFEWRKFEGMAYDEDNNILYAAMTRITDGMLDNEDTEDIGGPNHIRMPENKCGMVFAIHMDDDYIATSMNSVIAGIPLNDGAFTGNYTCHPDSICEPDNVAFMKGYNELIIYEDCGHKINNMMFSAHMEKDEVQYIQRIATVTVGAEATGGFYHQNIIGDLSYLTLAVQHPYSDYEDWLESEYSTGIEGWVGYLGPFPPYDGHDIMFEAVNLAKDDKEKQQVRVSYQYTKGVIQDTGFTVLLRSGDMVEWDGKEWPFGLMINKDYEPVYLTDEEDGWAKTDELAISSGMDFQSLLRVEDKIFLVTHFEAPYPAVMYLTEVAQEEDGHLTVLRSQPIDWSEWGGTWITCAGSVTPWETHLGSEEYEPDAKSIADCQGAEADADVGDCWWSLKEGLKYWDIYENPTGDEMREIFNPYLYGYPTEVKVYPDGSYEVMKHYAMGRAAIELAYVMPDKRTAYITDDGTNVAFFKFVADKEGDLSQGTLYGAKFEQHSADKGGMFGVEWLYMAYGSTSQVARYIEKLRFYDIFEVAEGDEEGACPDGFTPVNQQTGGFECLNVKKGMETAAAFLETRRYLGYIGGTTEFRKWEGITFNPATMTLYTAMSEVGNGMNDNDADYDLGTPNHVRVPENTCGCVYALDVDSDYSAYNMYSEVCGLPDDSLESNTCSIAGIANPDNLSFIPGTDQILIGEDSSEQHQNDAMYMYDTHSKRLTRVLTTPFGAETTSPYFYGDVNGYDYFMSVVQHPYGESDEDKVDDEKSTGGEGYVGYIKVAADAKMERSVPFSPNPN